MSGASTASTASLESQSLEFPESLSWGQWWLSAGASGPLQGSLREASLGFLMAWLLVPKG